MSWFEMALKADRTDLSEEEKAAVAEYWLKAKERIWGAGVETTKLVEQTRLVMKSFYCPGKTK